MQRWLCYLVAASCAFAAPGAHCQEVPNSADALVMHSHGDVGRLEYDEDAKKLVMQILSNFEITSTNWDILLAPDDRDTAFAMARYVPTTHHHQIIFNQVFMNRIGETAGRWAPLCVASHEIGHLLRLHVENHSISIFNAELEADFYCGFVLGKMGADYDQTVSAIAWFNGAADYPTRDQRIAQIGNGWKDATGRPTVIAAAEDVGRNAFAAELELARGHTRRLPNPAPVASNPAVILEKFDYRNNRDLLGYDLISAGGHPGIPGLNLEMCAKRCDENSQCKAFSFDRWNGWCFLKSRVSTSLLDPPSILGVKKPGELPKVSTAPAEMIVLLNKRFRDQPILIKAAADLQSCKKKCSDELRCVAFSFLKSASRSESCQMFNKSEGYYSDEAADSGFKRQLTAQN